MKNKIIVHNEFSFTDAGYLTVGAASSPDGLFRKVLYWDNIVNLQTESIESYDNEDITLLKKEGIYENEVIGHPNIDNFIKNLKDLTQKKMIELVNHKTINYIADELPYTLPDIQNIEPSGGCLLHLTNVLPSPNATTNIHDVLNFRLKRGEHLRNLLNHINSLNIRVMSSENPGMELKKVINEIDIAAADVTRIYKESKIELVYSNIKINFNMKEIIGVAGATFGGATIFFPQSTAAILGVIAGASSLIRWTDAIKIKSIKKDNPFNYVAMINSDLIK
ncbi:TPA: hypothetical protein MFB39_000770 [Klebsiella pneumoniae]|uniref:DUF6236 family protein n=1 Tax=Klebsiella pneumoniae TaxID=573 RepID=UPI0025A03D0E|nr:DUF6236 family protein [Klebsiella pneumoniae]MDM7427944.1 DUF6236 family protein [Klebsiella pneumoniae]HBU8487322.1 hypothetical protein [Klebsiella pneumoniae]HBW4786354.1 hypothetical protein [Klebsiella pneumoniae]HBW5338585.1 hypothetical protein [Klebsiella pneumoniae]HBW5415266.1 hypothetical protein [Klebsiella pneumoniae]